MSSPGRKDVIEQPAPERWPAERRQTARPEDRYQADGDGYGSRALKTLVR
jgi:hypothetical protein